jgi:hypothetical protein
MFRDRLDEKKPLVKGYFLSSPQERREVASALAKAGF